MVSCVIGAIVVILDMPFQWALKSSSFFVGCLAGGFILTSHHARRLAPQREKMLLTSLVSISIAGVLTAFAPNMWAYAALRCGSLLAGNNCVYRNVVHHSAGEFTQVLQEAASDPTLPRTKDVRCSVCGHGEAVLFQGRRSPPQCSRSSPRSHRSARYLAG
nr:unnamed protein product [Digitaria exilis]